MLERDQLRVPFTRWGCWGFYSSEVLPPFLIAQVCSLLSKSHPCRTSLFLVGQVLSLQPKSLPCRASLQESKTWWTSLGLRFVRDSTPRMGSTFFWPMDMDPLGSPNLISYFILFNLYLKWNFLRIWLWKWKKWILFYERSLSKTILIENTNFFFFFGCVYIYNLSNKKCVYIIKKRAYVYIYICVWKLS